MTAQLRQITAADVLRYDVTAPHLAGGLIIYNGQVVIAQQLVRFMIGWQFHQVKKYCDWRGWIFEQVKISVRERQNDNGEWKTSDQQAA